MHKLVPPPASHSYPTPAFRSFIYPIKVEQRIQFKLYSITHNRLPYINPYQENCRRKLANVKSAGIKLGPSTTAVSRSFRPSPPNLNSSIPLSAIRPLTRVEFSVNYSRIFVTIRTSTCRGQPTARSSFIQPTLSRSKSSSFATNSRLNFSFKALTFLTIPQLSYRYSTGQFNTFDTRARTRKICKERWSSSGMKQIVDREVVCSNLIYGRWAEVFQIGLRLKIRCLSLIDSDHLLHRYSG